MDYVYSRQEGVLSYQSIDKIQQPSCFCNPFKGKILKKRRKPRFNSLKINKELDCYGQYFEVRRETRPYPGFPQILYIPLHSYEDNR